MSDEPVTAAPGLQLSRARRRVVLVLVALAAALAVLALAFQAFFPGPDERATGDALKHAKRIARDAYVMSGSYSGGQTPTNAAVAGEIATGVGVHELLATSVVTPDRNGVGTLATVDVVVIGVTDLAFGGGGYDLPVCLRFTVVRERTGPRDIRYDQIPCPPDVTPTR